MTERKQIIDGKGCRRGSGVGALAAVKSRRKAVLGYLKSKNGTSSQKLHSSPLSSHLETQRPLTCTSSHLPLSLPAPTTQSKPQSALARIKELPEIPPVSIICACACKRHIFACCLLVVTWRAGGGYLNGTGFNGAFKQTQHCSVNAFPVQSPENVW